MKQYSVHHAADPIFRIPTRIDLRKYNCVALVVTKRLDMGFELIDSIDRHWGENPEVTMLGPRTRSTSVSDPIHHGTTWWAVDSCGFRKVDDIILREAGESDDQHD